MYIVINRVENDDSVHGYNTDLRMSDFQKSLPLECPFVQAVLSSILYPIRNHECGFLAACHARTICIKTMHPKTMVHHSYHTRLALNILWISY